MGNWRKFIRIGDDRINCEEIVSYGTGLDEDGDVFLYVETKTSEDVFRYNEFDIDFDIDEKIAELDGIFLIGRRNSVDFDKR